MVNINVVPMAIAAKSLLQSCSIYNYVPDSKNTRKCQNMLHLSLNISLKNQRLPIRTLYRCCRQQLGVLDAFSIEIHVTAYVLH